MTPFKPKIDPRSLTYLFPAKTVPFHFQPILFQTKIKTEIVSYFDKKKKIRIYDSIADYIFGHV